MSCRHAASMHAATVVPALPPPLALLLKPLPLLPLRLILQRAAESVVRRRPGLCARLEEHAEKLFLIDPIDCPFVFRLRLHPDRPMIEPRRREEAGSWDARIAGVFAALLGMVHGAYDGDALFFSRDLLIEGDTEAVLALRNALDDAEIDLSTEIAAAFGPAGGAAERVVRIVSPAFRAAGVALKRTDESR